MTPRPINIGESVLEAFWDPSLRNFDTWQVTAPSTVGLQLEGSWCAQTFSWLDSSPKESALTLSKEYSHINCTPWDSVLLSIHAPIGSVVVLEVTTDLGVYKGESKKFLDISQEVRVDIGKSCTLKRVTIEIRSSHVGYQSGSLLWILLESSSLLKQHLAQYDQYDTHWREYLQGEEYTPTFLPYYGLILSPEELNLLRKRHSEVELDTGRSMYKEYVEGIQEEVPERMIHDFVVFWTDRRFARERDWNKRLTQKGPILASAGVLLQDKKLLRLAARFAMSLAMCPNWNDSFITEFSGGHWEHRSFVKSIICYELAVILDLAGDMFTPLGRDLILRRLAEEAIGGINFVNWKHDYIYHNNQLAWFSHGKLIAYGVLEHHFQHVQPYTDLAYKELLENIDNIMYSDGAYGEGPNYFNCIGNNANLGIYVYAKLRNKPFKSLVPSKILKTGDFIECLRSTVPEQDVIPLCDGSPCFEERTLAFMAYLLPNTHWSALYRKRTQLNHGIPKDIISFVLQERTHYTPVHFRHFVALPEMGSISSVRYVSGEPVKIGIWGNKAYIDHAHEDKGSFVIEFCHETFAMDPGSCDYATLLSDTLKHGYRHNISIPMGSFSERPHPERPNTKDIKVIGSGNDTGLSACVDLSDTWSPWFKTYTREFFSETPDRLVIKDTYELAEGEGIDFGWSTELPVEISPHGDRVTISGSAGRAIISLSKGVIPSVEQLPLAEKNRTQQRISFKKFGLQGELQISVVFETYSG